MKLLEGGVLLNKWKFNENLGLPSETVGNKRWKSKSRSWDDQLFELDVNTSRRSLTAWMEDEDNMK